MTGIKRVNLVDEKKGRQMVKDRRWVVSSNVDHEQCVAATLFDWGG